MLTNYAQLWAEFPRIPTGILARHITEEADKRLSRYLPISDSYNSDPGMNAWVTTQLPEGVIDTPLVRIFNFLRACSRLWSLVA